jgi:nucleolysin TIA-1/TIAR
MADSNSIQQMPNAVASAASAPAQYQPLSMPQTTMDANAMTDAMNNNGNGMGSPGSAGGPRRAAPEPNKRALYVGGLDPRVTEEVLKQIFETTGHVQSVKIIPDKNVSLVTLLVLFLLSLSLLSLHTHSLQFPITRA